MTRTTDISLFKTVTTVPDEDWGTGLTATAIGQLIDGAYITNTSKSLSLVVTGVSKTKCKLSWEFDTQGHPVKNSTMECKYSVLRAIPGLRILPGACPEAMTDKGLASNIGWSDAESLYRFQVAGPIEAAELEEGITPPTGMRNGVASSAALWRLELNVPNAKWECVDPRFEIDTLLDDGQHKDAFVQWGEVTLAPRGELTRYQKHLMSQGAILAEGRLSEVFLKVVAGGWGWRLVAPPMPQTLAFVHLLDIIKGIAEAAQVDRVTPESLESVFSLLLPRAEGTPFPLADKWVEVLEKLSKVFPITAETAMRDEFKQIQTELARRVVLPRTNNEHISTRQLGKILMEAVKQIQGDDAPKLSKAANAVNGMLSGNKDALKQMVHPGSANVTASNSPGGTVTPNKPIPNPTSPPPGKGKAVTFVPSPASPAGMIKPIGTGDDGHKQFAGACVGALALPDEQTQDEVLEGIFADKQMSEFMFSTTGHGQFLNLPWLNGTFLRDMRANVIARLFEMAKLNPDPTSVPPDVEARKGIIMSIIFQASQLNDKGEGSMGGTSKTSRKLGFDCDDDDDDKVKGRGVATARSDADKAFAMSAYVATALTSLEVESAVANSKFDGLDGHHAIKAFATDDVIGEIFGKYTASNGKIREAGVVPAGRSIPPKIVAGKQEFHDVVVALLQGPDEVAVHLDIDKVKKLADAMIKMQFKLTDIVETMGSNNASSLRQSAWSKMQAAMVRVKPAFALVLSFYSSLGSPVWHEDDSFTHLCTHVTDFSVTNDIPHETMSKFVDSNIFGLFKLKAERWRAGDSKQPKPPSLKEIIDSTKPDLLEKARDARADARFAKSKRESSAAAAASSSTGAPRKAKKQKSAKGSSNGGASAGGTRGEKMVRAANNTNATSGQSGARAASGGDKMKEIVHAGQEFLSHKFPASGGTKTPCFAIAWGKTRCNFPPCKDKNEHDASRFPAGVSECLKGYLRSKSIPATFSEWSEANPRA